MKCPYCGCEEDRVVDSRPTDEGAAVRRRRECTNCLKRFTTYEKIEYIPLMVVKRDSKREPFSREKLVKGMMKAFEKRPVSPEVIDDVANDIENKLYNSLKREVTSREIGEMIMARLKEIDEVAYIRFASVYRQFKDLSTFQNELKLLLRKK
jgi:transcriptional repressor NrdR